MNGRLGLLSFRFTRRVWICNRVPRTLIGIFNLFGKRENRDDTNKLLWSIWRAGTCVLHNIIRILLLLYHYNACNVTGRRGRRGDNVTAHHISRNCNAFFAGDKSTEYFAGARTLVHNTHVNETRYDRTNSQRSTDRVHKTRGYVSHKLKSLGITRVRRRRKTKTKKTKNKKPLGGVRDIYICRNEFRVPVVRFVCNLYRKQRRRPRRRIKTVKNKHGREAFSKFDVYTATYVIINSKCLRRGNTRAGTVRLLLVRVIFIVFLLFFCHAGVRRTRDDIASVVVLSSFDGFNESPFSRFSRARSEIRDRRESSLPAQTPVVGPARITRYGKTNVSWKRTLKPLGFVRCTTIPKVA